MAENTQGSQGRTKLPGHDEAVAQALARGLQHLQAGRLKDAEKIFREVITVEPTSSDAMHYLGLVAMQSGRPEVAAEIIDQALILAPRDAAALSNQGLAYQAMGQFDAAEAAFRRAIECNPNYAEAYNNLGTIHQLKGQSDEAIAAFEKAIAVRPKLFQAMANLGMALQNAGRYDLAEAAYERALKANPDYVEGHIGLGNLHSIYGRNMQAMDSYMAAIRAQPKYAPAYSGLAGVYAALARFDEAEAACRRALELDPNLVDAHLSLGTIMGKMGREDAAIAACEKAIELNPNSFMGHSNLAGTLASFGKKDEAIAHYQAAIGRAPENADLVRQMMALTKYTKINDDIRALQAMVADENMPKKNKLHLCFALGKIFDELGEHEKAFDYFTQGNAIVRASFEYSRDEQAQNFARLRKVFSPAFFEAHKDAGNPAEEPVFILGMPRSGTTLVEQILGNHPDVYASGELLTLPGVIAAQRGKKRIADFAAKVDDATLTAMGREYLDIIKAPAGGALRITDKLPANFMFVGLIKTMFPNAKIINCTRAPQDNGLSIFKTYFSSVGNFYSADLGDIGHYIGLYRELMAHWHEVLPGFVFDTSYEAMVADQEGETRKILGHLGLEWSDACLDFTKSNRPVHTASVAQVREPIYNRSVGLWRKYGDRLQPLMDALEEAGAV